MRYSLFKTLMGSYIVDNKVLSTQSNGNGLGYGRLETDICIVVMGKKLEVIQQL